MFIRTQKQERKFINKNMQNSNHVERSISDYIAGMTDRYAINLYNFLKWIYLTIILKNLMI